MSNRNYKVWLVKAPELKNEQFLRIENLLKSIPGVIKFKSPKKQPDSTSQQQIDVITDQQISKKHIWFFERCNAIRQQTDISENDMVIYLTDLPNENNYFLRIDPENRNNAYIQTSGYEDYFPGSDIIHPIAYQIAITVLMMQWFKSHEDAEKVINYDVSKGGVLDFCRYKKDIGLKLRTADFSSAEIESLKEKNVDSNLILHVLDILEKLRGFMLLKRRYEFKPDPLVLTINTTLFKFYFEEIGNVEVPLNDLEKAFYLTFLKCEKGIYLEELQNYEEEMFNLYNNKISMKPLEKDDKGYDKRVKSIKRLCKKQSYSEFRNTILKKFELAVGSDLAILYAINGEKSYRRKINLDRKYFRLVDLHGNKTGL